MTVMVSRERLARKDEEWFEERNLEVKGGERRERKNSLLGATTPCRGKSLFGSKVSYLGTRNGNGFSVWGSKRQTGFRRGPE